jgi:hypothetical protein
MSGKEPDSRPLQDPNALLEQALISEFLELRGYDLRCVGSLPDDERRRLLREASIHAAGKLAEVEARAHFVHELHGDTEMV